MKVLFFTDMPSPYRVDFFNELTKYCELTVIYEKDTSKNRESSWLKTKGINFKAEYLNKVKCGKIFSILKYLKDKSYDIVLISGYTTLTTMIAIEYLSKKNRPFVFNCDGGLIKQDKRIIKRIKTHFISKPTYWLSTGKLTDEYLQHYGADSKRIFRYPFTSIKQSEIIKNKLTETEKYLIKENLMVKEEKICLAVGQYIHRKGFDVLINAAKYIDNNIGVYIIGGKPTEEYLALVENLKLENIHFIDFKSKDELIKYYKIADLFVLPTREDIWGLVINEAMTFGLPVITTEKCVAGLELIESEKNGYIIPVNDIQTLAIKINTICRDDKLGEFMSKNNIEKIQKYTIENMAREHEKIFKNILQGR